MQRGIAAVALLAFAVGVWAADKTDFAAEFKRIESQSRQGLIQPGGVFDQDKAAAARKKADADLDALAKKAEATDRKTMTPEDLSAVAQTYLRLRKAEDAVKWAGFAIEADPKIPSGHETKVRALATQKKVDGADQALAAAPPLNPAAKASLHLTLSTAYRTERNNAAAAKHLREYVAYQRSNLARNPLMATSFVFQVRTLAQLQGGEGLKDVDLNLAEIQRVVESKPQLWTAVTDLKVLKVDILRGLDKKYEADKLLKEETEAVDKAFAEATGDLRATHLTRKSKIALENAEAAESEFATKLRTDLASLLVDEATKHRKEPAIVRAAISALMTMASSSVRSDPRASQAALDRLKGLVTMLGGDIPSAEKLQLDRQVAMLTWSLTAELGRFELVGKPMPEFTPAAWLNGAALTPNDLKGKVVLIDCWAVWCGPCIATFPHLREWNEKHAKDGLVIIGATKYYKYAWDAEAKRPERHEDLESSVERAETEKFLAHHQLKHPIAFFSDNSFSEAFHVTGIPQAVVVDRKGMVRLIKVGSGEANAKAIDEMIKKCLAEPAN